MAGSVLDSIRPNSRVDNRVKYSQQLTGRLHKGHGLVAASASIPSKFQTIVTDNSEQKGFGSASRRFQYDSYALDGPAPAHYQHVTKVTKESSSFSKKGTGGFASRVRRFPRLKEQDVTVAPGQYDPLRKPSHYFNKASCTSNFHKPIAVKNEENDKHKTPGPNHYMIPNKVTGRVAHVNNVAACAAFRSRSKRDLLDLKTVRNVPAPGAYNINERITKSAAKGVTAPFKSTTDRNMILSENSFPGPGTYRPFEHVELPDRKQLPRKHYLCISAPAIPLPPSPPAPGPGHYNIVDYQGGPRKFVSSSVFVSSTSRWTGDETGDDTDEPGPASYNPQSVGRQSFIYNTNHKWI